MSERFPFFYYDLVARVIPGALLLTVLWLAGINLPPPVTAAVSPEQGVLEPAILSLIYFGACYAIGVAFEVSTYFFDLRRRVEQMCDRAFQDAIRDRRWRRSVPKLDGNVEALDPRWLRRHCWNWLQLHPQERRAPASIHALRYTAESKMFLHMGRAGLFFPVMVLSHNVFVWARLETTWWEAPKVSFLLAVALGLSAFLVLSRAAARRERQRWGSAIDALDELWSAGDNSDALVAACEQYRLSLQHSPSYQEGVSTVTLERRNANGQSASEPVTGFASD